MSKRYRLIKCFPGSPPIDTIVRQRTLGYQLDNGYGSFFNEDIENYPEFWKEIKEPILKTDDGVDLYKNDYFWHVDPYFGIAKGVLDTTYPEFKPIKGYKHFSTEKAAKEYIEINKPKQTFTTEDGINLFAGDECWYILNGFHLKYGPYFDIILKQTKHIFSTEKAAKEWIEMNKPKYSMKDVLDMKIWNIKDRHTLELNLPELCRIYNIK